MQFGALFQPRRRVSLPVVGTILLAAAFAGGLSACRDQRAGEAEGAGNAATSASPARTPPDQKSEEAETPQIRLAKDEGKAYRASLDYMVQKVAVGGGAAQRSGDYLVAYAEEKAEGMYMLRDGRLEWTEPKAENAHLEVSVSDGSDGRFIPYLEVTATLIAPGGKTLGPYPIPFVWHPGLFHYGRNIVTPGDGVYTVRIHVAPPRFPRHDKVNGQRYAEPVDVTFSNVRFKTGHG